MKDNSLYAQEINKEKQSIKDIVNLDNKFNISKKTNNIMNTNEIEEEEIKENRKHTVDKRLIDEVSRKD